MSASVQLKVHVSYIVCSSKGLHIREDDWSLHGHIDKRKYQKRARIEKGSKGLIQCGGIELL